VAKRVDAKRGVLHEHDPEHWGSLGAALLTLFQMVTLEGWVDVMETAMEVHSWSWIYFVSFVLIGTFVMLNLFIAVVINNLDASKAEKLEQLGEQTAREEILQELERTREALASLQHKIEALPARENSLSPMAGRGPRHGSGLDSEDRADARDPRLRLHIRRPAVSMMSTVRMAIRR
jgi:hypothetical protein